ncbi:MAG: tetraacyldisaccharide 4'-kinase, partial [Blastocatellia bacterium]
LEARAPISAFVLDDAYQHLRLKRDLNLLLIDATEPLGRAAMVPLGRLREPLAELRRADAFIVTRSDQEFDRVALIETIKKHSRPNAPIFFAHHEMTKLRRLDSEGAISITEFAGKKVAAVSGIAKPDRFNDDLRKAGIRIVLRRDFPDHHHYSAAEFSATAEAAQSANAEAIIVTEKDAANLSREFIRQSSLPVYSAQIEFRCNKAIELKEKLLSLAPRSRKS